MRAPKLIGDHPKANLTIAPSSDREIAGYEQRLMRWGCAECMFFEEKVFKTGLAHDELDAYMICRFLGEPVDLIGEATDCPKVCKPQPQITDPPKSSTPQPRRNKTRLGRGKLRCVHGT
jgi:hypothetical protein